MKVTPCTGCRQQDKDSKSSRKPTEAISYNSYAMTRDVTALDDPYRTGRAYSVAEVATLAGTTSATVRRWLKGYAAPGHHMEPVFGPGHEDDSRVSFLELIEFVVAMRFRKDENVSLERVRRAHAYARRVWLVPFPFATMRFKVFGGHLMHEFEEAEPGPGHLAFDMEGQWALPGFVQEVLVSVDFDSAEYAERWYPYGKDRGVVIDPHFAAGRPVIEGTRTTVRAIRERWQAGETIRTLARDYGLTTSTVEDALRLAPT